MKYPKLFIYLLAALAAVTFLFLVWPYGLGLTPDSIAYLEVAQQIQQGNGIVDSRGNLVTHWPPLYPLLMAASSLFQDDLLRAALFLNTLLMAGLVISFHALLRYFGLGLWLALIFSALLLVAEPTGVFMMAWSEGPFILFTLLSAVFFCKWDSSGRHKYIFIAGVLSGLSLLTRYAGAGFIGGYLIYLFLISGKPLRDKILASLRYLLPVLLLMGVWLLYSHGEGDAARTLVWHPVSFKELGKIFTTILSWFAPNAVFAIIGLGLLLFVLFRKRGFKKLSFSEAKYPRQLRIILTLILTYLGFLVVSKLWFDAHTPLNTRILAPIFPFLLLLFAVFVQSLYTTSVNKNLTHIFVLFLLVSFTFHSAPFWIDHHQEGSSYSAKIWKESETLAYAKELETPHIYSNGYDILPIYSDSEISKLPLHTDPVTRRKNDSYKRELKQMEADVKNGKALLVYFDNVNWRWYLMTREEILDLFADQEIIHFEDGFVVSPHAK